MNKLSFFVFFLALTLLPLQWSLSQVVINEITADPGNYDGQGAEWTELYNAGGSAVDLSCYILTDGEEIVLFPSGTYIPAGGYLLVYNSYFFNCPTCNWDPAISALIDNVGSLASPDPDGTTSVDVATCGCTNQSGCFSVTWDNGGNSDRVVLFNENAAIVDAVYWGNGESEAPAASPIPEGNYSQGPLTTGTGGDIIGGGTTGCTLPASNDYTIPALPAPASSDATWEYVGADNTGCTTSYGRIANGTGSNQAAWMLDMWQSPGQSNTITDYGITYTPSGGSATSFTSSDNITLNVCSGTTLSFSADINAFNQVFNDADGDAGNAVVLGGGSLINATGGLSLTNQAWTEAAITASGVTNLSYITAPITANTTITLKIKENTQSGVVNPNASGCAGAGANIGGSGSAGECYIQKTITVNVVQAITAISYTCTNGVVTVTTTPASGFGSYNLFLNNAVNDALDRNFTVTSSPFVFSVTQGTATDYTLTATGTQTPNCAVLPVVTGGPICVFAPPCPTFAGYTGCTTATASALCVGSSITLGLNGSGFVAGTTIEWVQVANAADNPYSTGTVIATSSISVTTASVYLSQTVPNPTGTDCALGGPNNETATISNSTASPITLNGYTITTTGGGGGTFTIPNGTVIPASGSVTFGLCPLSSGVPTGATFLTNSGANANATLRDNTGTAINTLTWSTDPGAGVPVSATGVPSISTVSCASYTIPVAACSSSIIIKPRVAPEPLGCVGSSQPTLTTLTYTINPCPTATISGETAICAGASANMPVTIANNPGACTNATIQYSVNGGATQSFGPAAISGGQVTVTGLSLATPGMTGTGGTVTLVGVTFSGAGCTACTATLSGTFVVTVAPNPAAPVASAQEICNGQASILTASGENNLRWYSDAGLTTQIASGASIAYTGASSTTLYVQSTNPDTGCKSTATPVAVTVNPVPSATPTGSSAVCVGQAITLNAGASGGTPTYTYFWSEPLTGGTLTSTNTSATGITSAVAGDAGTYTVLVTDSKNCYVRATKPVAVNALPAAAISGVTSYCGTAGPATPLTASGGDTFAWSTGANTASITPNISTVGQTTYTVTVTDSGTGCSASASTTVSVNPLFNICQGGTITASTTGCNVTAPYAQVFLLTDAAGVILQVDNVITDCAASFSTASLTVGNTYHVYALNYDTNNPPSPNYGLGVNVNAIGSVTSGCYNSDTFLSLYMCYTISAPPAVVLTGNDPCIGTPLTLTATVSSGTSPYDYIWNPNAYNDIADQVSPYTVTVTAAAAATDAIAYTVTVTDNNGCTATASTTPTINSLPVAAITGVTSYCGTTTTPSDLTATGGGTYAWSTGSAGASITPDASVIGTTTYTVTVTGTNSCTASASAMVCANPITDVCKDADIVATALGCNVVAPYEQVFFLTDASGLILQVDNVHTDCTATFTTTSLSSGSVYHVYALNYDAVASPGLVFNTGVNISTISGMMTGCYNNDSFLCSYRCYNILPVLTATLTGNDPCIGTPLTLTATVSSGTSPYDYIWNPNAYNDIANQASPYTVTVTAAAAATDAIAYTVTVTDNNGCTATASTTPVINSLPAAAITGVTSYCGTTTTPSDLTATGGGTYAWSTGSNSASITPDASVIGTTTYTVTVTGTNSCTASASAMVCVNPMSYVCKNTNIVVVTTGCNITAPYAQVFFLTDAAGVILQIDNVTSDCSATFSTASLTDGAVYHVYALNYDAVASPVTFTTGSNISTIPGMMTGCYNNDTFLCSYRCYTINPQPTFALTPSNPVCPDTDNGSILISGLTPGGTYAVEYAGPTSNTLPGLTASGTGTINITGLTGSTTPNNYTVTVTDSNDCSSSATTTVESQICCVADAGNIVIPTDVGTVTDGNLVTICQGAEVNAFSVSYVPADETDPTTLAPGYDLRYILADATGEILQFNADGNFTTAGLTPGTYDVFILSYYELGNDENDIDVYLTLLDSGNPSGGDIAAIVSNDDDSSSYGLSQGSTPIPNPPLVGRYCLDLDQLDNDGLDGVSEKVQIVVNDVPVCSINGSTTVCPSSIGNVYAAPAGMTYAWSISGNGTITSALNGASVTVTAGNTCNSSFTLSVTITDGNGCTSSCSQVVSTVDTTAPGITCPAAPLTIACGASLDPLVNTVLNTWLTSASGSDACGSVTVTNNYSQTGFSDLCGNTGSQTVTFTATDACGNTSTCSAVINITDTTAPGITCPASPLTIACGTSLDPSVNTVLNTWLTSASGTDACGSVTVTNNYSQTGFSDLCGNTGSQTVTFTATDACGNTSTCSAVINITDTTAPGITCPANLLLVCDGDYATEINTWISTATSNDACGTPTITTNFNINSLPVVACDAGTVTVIFTATDGCGNTATCSSQIIFNQTPGIQLYKTISSITDVNGDGFTGVGDIINYAFTVTNTGNVTLTNVTLSDPLIFEAGGPIASLAPGASNSTAFTGIYTITQADMNTGYVQNTATVTGTAPNGTSVTDISDAGNDAVETASGNGTVNGNPTDDPTVQPLNQTPAIQLYKTISSITDNAPAGIGVGDVINYAFTVTNTGNVTLTNVTVTDPLVTVVGGPIASMLPGASNGTTFTATYTITQTDVNTGYVQNTATTTGTTP
ncbi:hypothetical protein C7N43_26110, partial [Sphingobacteriales bacterium UPWRP_1]